MQHIKNITLSFVGITAMTVVFAVGPTEAQTVNNCQCVCMCLLNNTPHPAPASHGGIPLGLFNQHGGAGGNGGLLLGRLGSPIQVNRLNLLGHFSL